MRDAARAVTKGNSVKMWCRRAAAIIALCALAAFAVLSGCDCTVRIFVESDATWHHRDGETDERGTTDEGTRDEGMTGDGATGNGGAATDAGSDSSDLPEVPDLLDGGGDPPDAPDAGGDAGFTDTGIFPCAPGEPLSVGISTAYSSGDIDYLESVQVAYKGISLPGGTCNLMHFDAWGSEHRMEFCYNLPWGYEIPAAEGETVRLLVSQKSIGMAIHQKVILWDADNGLRFFFYSGDPGLFDPVECAEPRQCPAVYLADAACTPEEESCGKSVHPPVAFFMGGLLDQCAEVLQQGESRVYTTYDSRCAFVERIRLIAAQSYKMTENRCDDRPDAWLSALVFDNRKVSQCFCHGHEDCADGDVCETEVRRCMRAVPPEVPCQQGDDADPYTGNCVRPADPPNMPCETTADCNREAPTFGVCNTYWKEKYGAGFCQPDPCPSVRCSAACSSLVGTCFECLSDCDCYVPEQPGGRCDPDTRVCVPR